MLTAAGADAGVLKGRPAQFGVATSMGLMLLLVSRGIGSLVLGHPCPPDLSVPVTRR